MTDSKHEKLLDRTFGKCLDVLLFIDGARTPGSKKKSGECWTVAEFAHDLSVDEKTVRNWLLGKKTPRYLHTIEKALFGIENKTDPRNIALREAHRRARLRGSKEAESDVLASARQSPSHFGTGSPNAILHASIRPVPGFTGREDLLASIDGALWQRGGTAVLTNSSATAAVKGLGGVGKSVLAREYAWRGRERYRGVWWVRAETEQTIIDDLIELGSRLIPNLEEVQERNRALHLALDAIAGAGGDKPWLIVYDNVEKPGAIARLRPRKGAHILITSRWPRWQGHAQELPVDVFPEETAVDFLLAERPHETREAAARLAAALGWLPLALSHARVYCAETNLSFDDYAKRVSELIQEAPEDAEYPASVFATFSLAIAKAAKDCPEAEKLMEIAAFLAPERIPLDMITGDMMSEKQQEKAVAALFKVSLITHDASVDSSRGINVHLLVQEVMRGRLGEGSAAVGKARALVLSALLPRVDSADGSGERSRLARVLPHAAAMASSKLNAGAKADELALCTIVGCHLHDRGLYADAELFHTRALDFIKRAGAEDHPVAFALFNNLALVYHAQGRYREAEALFKRALEIAESMPDENRSSTGAALNNLALVYGKQGRYGEAEPLLKRAHQITENAYGEKHLKTATSLANLATHYACQARYDQAERLLVRVLTITEGILGQSHPHTGHILLNLADVYHCQQRYKVAGNFYLRGLETIEKALGNDHPSFSVGLDNLACLYRNQGRFEEAEQLHTRAIEIAEKKLGNHPDTAICMDNLATLYRIQGRYKEAEPLCARAAVILERSLGSNHPSTTLVRVNLANLKRRMDADEA